MLTASDMLRAWERGEGRSQIERAVLLLECGPLARQAPMDLWSLPIGTRDGLLLDLREQTFGPSLRGHALCPACGQKLGFSSEVRALRVPPPLLPPETTEPPPRLFELVYEGWQLRFRLIDSHDLLAAAAQRQPQRARDLLLNRCLVLAQSGDTQLAPGERHLLPPAVSSRLLSALAEHDPQAEVLLSLSCPACQHAFTTGFDIASFFYAEVAAHAQRLLDEVSALARAYGWRESDILELGALRRRHYLDRVGHG